MQAHDLPKREIQPMVASADGFGDSEVIDAVTGQRLVFTGEYRWHMLLRPAEGKASVYLELLDVPIGAPSEVSGHGEDTDAGCQGIGQLGPPER